MRGIKAASVLLQDFFFFFFSFFFFFFPSSSWLTSAWQTRMAEKKGVQTFGKKKTATAVAFCKEGKGSIKVRFRSHLVAS